MPAAPFGLAGYVALRWRRRWPLAFAGYILVISVFSTVIMIFAVTGWGMFTRARRQLEVTPVAAGDGAVNEAAAAIRSTTHQALQELRSIVRVLRDDDEPGTAPPQPVAADLPALVAEASATTSIRADWDGIELAAVPPDTGRTLYRIVQEGLTNARKHAPGSTVEVTVDGTPDRGLSVTVTSWLPPGQPAPGHGASNGISSGAGLIGLRERAALAGGHIDAAVTSGNRFRLSGWLPWADR